MLLTYKSYKRSTLYN